MPQFGQQFLPGVFYTVMSLPHVQSPSYSCPHSIKTALLKKDFFKKHENIKKVVPTMMQFSVKCNMMQDEII